MIVGIDPEKKGGIDYLLVDKKRNQTRRRVT